MGTEHRDIEADGIHIPHAWKVADFTELGEIVPEALDLDKLALKTDDDTYHRLKSVIPIVWIQATVPLDEVVSRYSVNSLQLGTELIEGGEITIDAGNLTFSVEPMTYQHVDTWTDPLSPVVTRVTTAKFTGITPQFLNTSITSSIAIGLNGAIKQFSSVPTGEDVREYASIGVVVHSNLATISSASQATQGSSANIAGTFADFRSAFGQINLNGNVFTVKTLLTIKKSLGSAFGISQNYKNNPKNPNIVTTQAIDPVTFLLTYRDGLGGWTNTVETDIDPTLYDDGSGTLVSVGANEWTVQPIWLATGSGTVVIGYGQEVYATQDDALAAIRFVDLLVNPIVENLIKRASVVVRGGASDLAIPTDGVIISANKFGL